MKNDNLKKFNNLISGKKSSFFDNEEDVEWQSFSAKIIFKVLDFMKKSQPPLKQNELANLIGVSPQYVNKLLKGKENLTLETMLKLAKTLNIELYELLDSTEKSNTADINMAMSFMYCTFSTSLTSQSIKSTYLKKSLKPETYHSEKDIYNDILIYK
jgi:transcriptional regulator with XRE-family HTH domain